MKLAALGQILGSAKRAQRAGGLPVQAQLSEMAQLRKSAFNLLPNEYFSYRLYRPELSAAQKRAFIGAWAKDRIYSVQNERWLATGSDKLLTYTLLEGLGLPYPKVRAVVHPTRHHRGADLLRTPGELADWLRRQEHWPLYAKPAVSYLGYNNWLIDRVDRDADRLHFRNGEQMPVADFAARYGNRGGGGMILQELIRPHPDVSRVIGERLPTARIMLLNPPSGPILHRATLRIPVGTNMVDNFRSGKSGNMLGAVDPASGAVTRVTARIGFDFALASSHPDTGVTFDGFRVPDWERAKDILFAVTSAMTGLAIQSWDIAFGDQGPILLEVNPRGDFNVNQTADDRGIGDPLFIEFLEAQGLRI